MLLFLVSDSIGDVLRGVELLVMLLVMLLFGLLVLLFEIIVVFVMLEMFGGSGFEMLRVKVIWFDWLMVCVFRLRV